MRRIAVLGAGTMGHALALVFALGGHEVRLTDTDGQALQRSGVLMERALATLREASLAEPSWNAERLEHAVRRTQRLEEALLDAEIVVEAIIEQREAKRALYTAIDALSPPEAILASNTSYLDVFPLIPPARQRRALIAHWYTPPYLVDLVDIVGSQET
ncbi:MAG: 3-hydroxyacyl-CoA dehydrogenase family protein, partial [Acetobacteraceae bacterium]